MCISGTCVRVNRAYSSLGWGELSFMCISGTCVRAYSSRGVAIAMSPHVGCDPLKALLAYGDVAARSVNRGRPTQVTNNNNTAPVILKKPHEPSTGQGFVGLLKNGAGVGFMGLVQEDRQCSQ